MKKPSTYNIDGDRLTNAGRIDRRKFNDPKPAALPTHVYDVLPRRDTWEVWETCLENGYRNRVSQHRTERAAMRRAEIERVKQPNRTLTRKLAHKLAIDMPSRKR